MLKIQFLYGLQDLVQNLGKINTIILSNLMCSNSAYVVSQLLQIQFLCCLQDLGQNPGKDVNVT